MSPRILRRREAVLAIGGGVAAGISLAARSRGAEPPRRIDRLAIGNYGMKSLPLEAAIAAVAEIGFGGFECCATPEWDSAAARMPPERRRAVAALLAEKGLRLVAVMDHLPPEADEAKHRAGLARLAAAIELARDLAPGRRPLVQTVLGGGAWDDVKGYFRDRVGAWAALARENGATIGIKPHRFGAMSTPAQAAWLCGQLGDPAELRIVYDYSHYCFRDLPVADTIRDARGLIGYVAVKDAVRTGDKVAFALPGAAGSIDHAAIRRAVDAAGYAGDYCCEVSGQVWQQPGYDPLAAARTCHANLAAMFG
jgi:sugar phosphate isomerase/epimerase